MNEQKLKKSLFAFLVGLNILVVLCVFLPIFTSSHAIQSENALLSFNVVEMVKRIIDGKITDYQIITFVAILGIILLVALTMFSFCFNRFKNKFTLRKNCLFASLILLLLSIVFLVFAEVISIQPNFTTLMGETTSSTYMVGLFPYILLVCSILIFIICLIIKKKKFKN